MEEALVALEVKLNLRPGIDGAQRQTLVGT